MIPFNLRDARMIQQERLRRAESRRATSGALVPDSYRRHVPAEADVVEVVFGTACDLERIGA